jgi:hypothetical protein
MDEICLNKNHSQNKLLHESYTYTLLNLFNCFNYNFKRKIIAKDLEYFHSFIFDIQFNVSRYKDNFTTIILVQLSTI